MAERDGTGREPIALVGIGCRLPGGVDSPSAFWRVLCDGVDTIRQIPSDRFDIHAYLDAQPSTAADTMSRWGGFLDGVDQFDADFFEISPREAQRLDPQQRLLLEVAWEALEDAGKTSRTLSGSRTGVFVGQWIADYEAHLFQDPAAVDFHMILGTGRYSASGRISYLLGLQGPSLTLDAACSSSLVAVHLACQSLWSGETSMALAGGVNVILQPHISVGFLHAGMIAPDGRCKFGDARANGFVRSEGAGLVVLEPLSLALANGDPIYAVIRGSAVNNDGRTSGFLATPGREGQVDLLRTAYAAAGVAPGRVQYIEAHGTGTSAGDPVELAALGAVVGQDRPADAPCVVGSVKTNFGHTEGAAGVTGLIKVALSLKHGLMPATLHFERPNPGVAWDDLGLVIRAKATPWLHAADPVVAGVSSFGIAGTNAHVVLEAAPPSSPAASAGGPYVLPVSARSQSALRALAGRYHELLMDSAAPPLGVVCATAAFQRDHHQHRLAVTGANVAELAGRLAAFADGDAAGAALRIRTLPRPRIAFVFPGQGGQWHGMGRQLEEREPVFQATLANCARAIEPHVDWVLADVLASDDPATLKRIDVVQPLLFAIQVALADLWRSWGIVPDAVVGHSLGEVAAAHVAGVLPLDDAARLICVRSRLLRRVSGRGAMAMVDLSAEDAQRALNGLEDRVAVAVSNSPRSSVLAGDSRAMARLATRFESTGAFWRWVKVDVASHSPQVDPLLAELEADLAGLQPAPARVPFYSTVTGAPLTGRECDAEYWARNLRQCVRFSAATTCLARDDFSVFLELSPHPVLASAVGETLREINRPGQVFASMRRAEPELETVLGTLAQLYTLGASVDWSRLAGTSTKEGTALPRYPWQRQRYWFDAHAPGPKAASNHTVHADGNSLLGPPFSSAAQPHAQVWEVALTGGEVSYLADHAVAGTAVLPAASYVELAVAAAHDVYGPAPVAIEQLQLHDMLPLPENGSSTLQVVLDTEASGKPTVRIFSRDSAIGGSGPWTLHASGSIETGPGTSATPPFDLAAVRAGLTEQVPAEAHAEAMRLRGLAFGPSFQTVAEMYRGDRACLARLRLPARLPPTGHAARTVLLDGCFQLLLASLPPAQAHATYVPVELDRTWVNGQPAPGGEVWGYVLRHSALDDQADAVEGDAFLLDGSGRVLTEVRGLRARCLDGQRATALDNWLYAVRWRAAPRPVQAGPAPSEPGSWLILADAAGVGQALANRLEAHGDTCVVASAGPAFRKLADHHFQVDPHDPAQVGQVMTDAFGPHLPPCRGAIHAWSLDIAGQLETSVDSLEETLALGCGSALDTAQALVRAGWPSQPRLWLVTRNTQAVDPTDPPAAFGQAPLWGLGRVIGQEHPELRCTSIDLDAAPGPMNDEVQAVFEELAPAENEPFEDQVALRRGARYVARLVHQPVGTDTLQSQPRPLVTPDEAYQLAVTTPGILESLTFHAADRRAAGPGEVEIQVRACGLNFLDVLKAMGVYGGLQPGAAIAMGGECAGVVSAVGPGVHDVRPGDAVVAIAPTFDSCASAFVTVPTTFVAPKPDALSYEQAASVAIVFMTAHYALHQLGHLRSGERVLIHAAAGGVGLAAVQLARKAGAEIYATAGSPEKRAFLQSIGVTHVFDSRTLSFASEILDRTDQRGVDVVLNSLAGEFIPASLSVLGQRGRFLEIGKRDFYANSQLGLEPFKRNLAFFGIDLAGLAQEDPALVGSLFQQTVQLFRDGGLEPLPTTVFPVEEVEVAFRHLAQARHTGKVVLDFQRAPSIVDRRPMPTRIHADGTYLVTGGLGGLGLVVAEWLVGCGARHLVLVGRGGPSATAASTIADMHRRGVEVVLMQADVAARDQVARVLDDIHRTLPPLRGLIHAAGILADATLLQQDRLSLRRAMAPKVLGAWNLHELTSRDPLDFFVLFSSIAAVLGSPGQANYAAANSFLDALAAYRAARGLHALSINWGPWSAVGLAAARADRGERLALRGLQSLEVALGLALLEHVLLRSSYVQVGAMSFDAGTWSEAYPYAALSPLLAELRETTLTPMDDAHRFREVLLATPPGRKRREVLEGFVLDQLARVLGQTSAQLDVGKPFKTMGLDSLMAIEFRNRLEAGLGLTLSATLAWNYPSLDVLVPHLAEQMAIPLAAVIPPPAAPQAEGADLAGFASLSVQDVEALLAGELGEIDELLSGATA